MDIGEPPAYAERSSTRSAWPWPAHPHSPAGGGGAAGVVAMHARVERQRLHEVVEERELDLHQGTVAGVLAPELLQQTTQLRRARGGKLRAGGIEEHREPRKRHRLSGNPKQRAGALEQLRAGGLDLPAAGKLTMQHAGEAHDGVHIARANRGPLLQHDLQQPLHGGDLGVEMGEHFGAERIGFHDRDGWGRIRASELGNGRLGAVASCPATVRAARAGWRSCGGTPGMWGRAVRGSGAAGAEVVPRGRGTPPLVPAPCAAAAADAEGSSEPISCPARPRPPSRITPSVSVWGSSEESMLLPASPPASEEPSSPAPSPDSPSPERPLLCTSEDESCCRSISSKPWAEA